MFYFPYFGNNNLNWLSYFSEGQVNHQAGKLFAVTGIAILSKIHRSSSESWVMEMAHAEAWDQLWSLWHQFFPIEIWKMMLNDVWRDETMARSSRNM